ncbi:GDSL-type esterase/lipase family protein [Citrobacter freundii complex sp. 2023EL-00966]|uniref:tail fiber/spike domain-containing protein n=1 Tax=Citrobacter freundii complex sp. 2023EL-00966 TaxID=3076118 RepID=UPI002894B786|nr:GDSL-type esterase/lipase family protein [Citrobacter freundii complex sp. 2023EL-00966]MDT3755043.1 GDSL-type esterase/lipase family protein [Citrobacter freundii complex sp. 2023EL-00966]
MTTYKTGNPLGSAAAKDLYDNAENLDHLSLDTENETWPDRLENQRHTWYGIEKKADRAISRYGYITKDSFEDGSTISLANECLRWKNNGEYYRWDGTFPKVVPPGSTPDSSGGIGKGKWIGVGDASLRADLAAPDGVMLVNGAASIGVVNDSIASAKDEITNNLASGFSSCADIARNLAYGGSQIIDVFGDSTMWGANPSGVTQQNPINPPKVLNDTLIALYGYIVTVNNKAISGTTLHQMLTGTDGSGKTFEQRVIESNAVIIYCNHAINDSNLSADITQYRNDWVEFVRIVRKYGKVPVIITPNPNPITNDTKVASSKRLNHYANVQRDVAKALKVDLVDNYEYFMRSLPMYHQSYLVPDGAHPITTGYIMAGQNMAIPLVSAPTLRRAGDVCTLTDVSYFDNFTTKTFDNSGPRTGTTLLATMPAGGGQGINLPVIIEYPTVDTVMGIIGLQSSDGTKVNLSFNGGSFGADGNAFYSGNIQQKDERVSGKYNGMFLPEKCKLPAGLHVIGLSFAGDADVGKYLGFGGLCLVDRQQYCTSEYQIYDPIVPGTSVAGRFDWSTSGNKLRFSSKDGNIEVFSISNNGSAIVATVDGADTVIASGSGDVYDYLIHFTQVGVSLRVGAVSKDIPLSIPLPDMYIASGSGAFMKTLVVA